MEQIRISELFAKLKPFVLDVISTVGGGTGPFAPSPHDLSSGHHTGSISDAQAPQFLKADGSRMLIGNLTAADGITIDGVDLSAFRGAYDTHAGLDAAAAHGSVGLHSHQNNPGGGLLDHGLALSGLGDDDHAQYAHADGSGTRRAYEAGRLNRSVIAGAGLTGGGLLTADRTLDVGAGAGIAVSADAVAVDTAAAFTWTGAHTFQGSLQTRHVLPELTDTYDLGSSIRLWRKGWLSELDAVLFAQNTITLLGGWLLITKDEGAIDADVTGGATQINFGRVMTAGDFVLFRAALKVEYMQVGSLVSGTTYNVTRNLDGSGADTWPAGTPFAVLGQSGQGRIELNAFDTPRLQMIRQGATFNAQTELIRLGDLNGNWDYTSQKWGLAIGDFAAGRPNITIDEDGVLRFRLHTTEVMRFGGGNADITGLLRMSGAASAITIGATPPTSSSAGTGIWIDRTGLYGLNADSRQTYIGSDGRLYAASGFIRLDAEGLHLQSSQPNKENRIQIRWYDTVGIEMGSIGMWQGAGGTYHSLGNLNYDPISTINSISGRFTVTGAFTALDGADIYDPLTFRVKLVALNQSTHPNFLPSVSFLYAYKNTIAIRTPRQSKIPIGWTPPWIGVRSLDHVVLSVSPLVEPDATIRDHSAFNRTFSPHTGWSGGIAFNLDRTIANSVNYVGTNATNRWFTNPTGSALNGFTWTAGLIWFFPHGTQTLRGILQAGTTNRNMLIYTNSDRVFVDFIRTDGSTAQVQSSNLITLNQWNYVAWRYGAGSIAEINLNGTISSIVPTNLALRTASGDFRLGWADLPDSPMLGYLGWFTAMSFKEMALLNELIDYSRFWHDGGA
ncbi:MAG: hypothetical protein AB1453_09600 [Chloroflexota bacterium]